jgi:NDP-sugar pyrophosphorylase family protein
LKTLLILAGGFGSRLKSAVSEVPKPLAPVCGKPFLKYIIDNCLSQGVNDLVFLLYYEADKIQDMLGEMGKSGCLEGVQIRIITEDKPMGTGGAVLNAIDKLHLDDSFLVMNADTWLGTGVKLINDAGTPSLAAVKVENIERYGSVKIVDGLVNEFTEKKLLQQEGLINAGLYHLAPQDFHGLTLGSSFSLEKEILPRLVGEQCLMALVIDTDFIDIGVPEDYFRFCKWIEQEEAFEL